MDTQIIHQKRQAYLRPKGSYGTAYLVWVWHEEGFIYVEQAEPDQSGASKVITVPVDAVFNIQRHGMRVWLWLASVGYFLDLAEHDYNEIVAPHTAVKRTIKPANKRTTAYVGGLLLLTTLIVLLGVGGRSLSTHMAYRMLTPDVEANIGRGIMQSIVKENRVNGKATKALKAFIKELDLPKKKPFNVLVINASEKNAFTLPGRNMVILAGIVSSMQSADELVALLGHEYGHMYLQHSRNGLAEEFGTSLVMNSMTSRLDKLTKTFEDIRELKHAREDELAADTMGVHVAVRNDMNPEAALWLLNTIAGSQADKDDDYFSTHPNTLQRKRVLQEHIDKVLLRQKTAPIDAERQKRLNKYFLDIQAALDTEY